VQPTPHTFYVLSTLYAVARPPVCLLPGWISRKQLKLNFYLC